MNTLLKAYCHNKFILKRLFISTLILSSLIQLFPITPTFAQETPQTPEPVAQLPILPAISPENVEITTATATDTEAATSASFRPTGKIHKLYKDIYQINEKVEAVLENVHPVDVTPTLLNNSGQTVNTVQFEKSQQNNYTLIEVVPTQEFQPGKYTLHISTPEGSANQEFRWGVLVINPDKAVYAPGEKADIHMAVLDEVGDMVCDASVVLKVTDPLMRETTLSTDNSTIKVNEECYSQDFTMTPDYQTSFVVSEVGVYSLTLTATTHNGTYSISDYFNVDQETPFIIERTAPTRIYPPHTYPVTLKVTAREDFTGKITDFVPSSFDIYPREEADGLNSYDDTSTVDSSTVATQAVLGESIGLSLPFAGSFDKTQGFGDVPDDPLLAKKYFQYGVIAHDGLDFALPVGTEVVSVDDGTIARAAEDGDYGTTIIVEHSWGKSYYGHLSEMKLVEGDIVTKGEVIGLSGNTGLSTGPHLHFGIKPTDSDLTNGYYGKIDPSPLLTPSPIQQVLGINLEDQQSEEDSLRRLDWDVSLAAGETITLGYSFKGPQISPALHLLGKLRFVDGEDQIVHEDSRQWQIASDAIVVNGGIVTSEAQFGGLQRKVAFVNNAWYAFYNDGTDVSYAKSADGETWNSPVDIDGTDADNYNPSIDTSGNLIHIFWLDESGDQVEGKQLDTSSDTLGTLCQLTSPGAFTVSTYMVSVASFSTTAALVAYSDTSAGSNVDIFDVTALDGSCASTDVHPGNITFGTQGSGLTGADRPVLVGIDSTYAMMVYQDGSNLRSARFDTSMNEWRRNNTLIANVSDSTYSVTTDGTSVWVLTQNSTTATRLYKCCTDDLDETQIDADAGAADDDAISDIDMFCPTEDNCKIVYTDCIDAAAGCGGQPTLNFVDCNDADCSSPTVTTLDADIGAANDQAGASIYCVASDNCKVVYGDDMNTSTPSLRVIDCTADEDCSSNTTSEPDTDLGTSAAVVHTDIDCVGGDTDCKFIYNDSTLSDVFFVDCDDANCGTLTITAVDGAAGTQPRLSLSCVAADNCKFVYMDSGASPYDMVFVDCPDAACTGTAGTCNSLSRTCTIVDTDVGTSGGGDANRAPAAIDCVGGDAECRFIYGDATDNALYFVDCDASAVCTTPVITQIDVTGGANGSTEFQTTLDCVSISDCKFIYVGDVTANAEFMYFGDCDNDTCTSGSVMDLSGPRFSGSVQCLTTNNCKLVYYDGSTVTEPTVQFTDCDQEDCLPTWSSLTAPWTSETNVTSVSLTYNSTSSELIANIIKDSTETAYHRTTSASSISWGSTTEYDGFSATGDMDHISSPETIAGVSQMGVLLRQGSNIEFDPVQSSTPEVAELMRHGKWYRETTTPTIDFEQSNHTLQTSIPDASESLSFSTTPATGSLIVVTIATFNGAIAETHDNVDDNQTNNTYTKITDRAINNQIRMTVWYAYNVNSTGTFTLTTTLGGGGGDITWAIHEYSGAATSTDPWVDDVDSTATGTNATSGNISTSQDGLLYFGSLTHTGNNVTMTPGTNYDDRENEIAAVSGMPLITEDKGVDGTVVSSGTHAATVTLGSSSTYIASIAAFKPEPDPTSGEQPFTF